MPDDDTPEHDGYRGLMLAASGRVYWITERGWTVPVDGSDEHGGESSAPDDEHGARPSALSRLTCRSVVVETGHVVDPEWPCFDGVPGVKIVSGGVRHLARTDVELQRGEMVTLLCGAQYIAPRRAETYVRFDCRWCAYALVEPDQPPPIG